MITSINCYRLNVDKLVSSVCVSLKNVCDPHRLLLKFIGLFDNLSLSYTLNKVIDIWLDLQHSIIEVKKLHNTHKFIF